MSSDAQPRVVGSGRGRGRPEAPTSSGLRAPWGSGAARVPRAFGTFSPCLLFLPSAYFLSVLNLNLCWPPVLWGQVLSSLADVQRGLSVRGPGDTPEGFRQHPHLCQGPPRHLPTAPPCGGSRPGPGRVTVPGSKRTHVAKSASTCSSRDLHARGRRVPAGSLSPFLEESRQSEVARGMKERGRHKSRGPKGSARCRSGSESATATPCTAAIQRLPGHQPPGASDTPQPSTFPGSATCTLGAVATG